MDHEYGRRHYDERLERIQQTLSDQQVQSAKLVVVTDNLIKSISNTEKWIDNHETHYQNLNLEMQQTKMVVSNWAREITEVKDEIRNLVTQVTTINSDGLKIKGAWTGLQKLAAFAVGLSGWIFLLIKFFPHIIPG